MLLHEILGQAQAQAGPARAGGDQGKMCIRDRVFVDAMKELPATLLLRPMNFDTLATWLYAEAARGTYEEGAVAALAIVLAGLLPVILLARTNLKMGH